jgi:hypothetical protein
MKYLSLMGNKLICFNVVLLLIVYLLAVTFQHRWTEFTTHAAAIISASRRVAPSAVVSQAISVPKPISALDYKEIAEETLFSSDRNPLIQADPPQPPPQPQEPVLPELPIYYGQMELGTPMIILGFGSAKSRAYQVGDKIGPFILGAFQPNSVHLEWGDRTLVVDLALITHKHTAAASATPTSDLHISELAPLTNQGKNASSPETETESHPQQFGIIAGSQRESANSSRNAARYQ